MEILAQSDDYCTLGSLENLFRSAISGTTVSNSCLNQVACGNGGSNNALMVELMLNYDRLLTDLPLWIHSCAHGQVQWFSPAPVTCGQLADRLKSLGGYTTERKSLLLSEGLQGSSHGPVSHGPVRVYFPFI
jgi:hypothetical protein